MGLLIDSLMLAGLFVFFLALFAGLEHLIKVAVQNGVWR